MTNIEMVAHNFWAQAHKLGIYDHSTGLPELLQLLIGEEEETQELFADALEAKGFSVTKD